MDCDCSTDEDNYPDFFVSKIVRSRKAHKCCECHQDIKPGEEYEKVTGKWDGKISTFKTCHICVLIRDDYCPHGFSFEGLRDAIWNCLGMDYVTGKTSDDEFLNED
jgi:hypothetical protein